jgi:hypothetical protein
MCIKFNKRRLIGGNRGRISNGCFGQHGCQEDDYVKIINTLF